MTVKQCDKVELTRANPATQVVSGQ